MVVGSGGRVVGVSCVEGGEERVRGGGRVEAADRGLSGSSGWRRGVGHDCVVRDWSWVFGLVLRERHVLCRGRGAKMGGRRRG